MAKILVLSQYWLPENGVPQRRWAWLSQILVQNSHEVSVLAPPPQKLRRVGLRKWLSQGGLFRLRSIERQDSGVVVFRSGFFPSGNSLTSRAFNQASVALSIFHLLTFRQKKIGLETPEVIIGTVPALPIAFVTALAAKRFGKPYILDLRDAWPELLHESNDWNSATGQRSLRERILRHGPLQILVWATEKLLDIVICHADAIITTSEFLADSIVTKYSNRGRVPRVVTIRNVFPVETPYRLAGRSSGHETLHVLYAGTIGRAQKLENALAAAKIVEDKGYKVSLRFIGEGAAWNWLRDTAFSMDLDVEVLHRLPAGDLEEYYRWADTALVHLASWQPLSRTVPSKTFELIEVGLHITAAVSGETATLVESLGVGCVVPPEDPDALANAWIAMIEDPILLKVNPEGRKWVQSEREVRMPSAFVSIVNEVLGQRRS